MASSLTDIEQLNDTLAWAAYQGFQKTCEVLLKAGAHPTLLALSEALSQGHLALAEQLLEAGADPNGEGPRVLSLCALTGDIPGALLLLRNGAIPNKDALTSASMEGHIEMVKVLLDWGANPWNEEAINYAKGDQDIEQAILAYQEANIVQRLIEEHQTSEPVPFKRHRL
ncbi:MAG: hypothetical protein B7X39_14115 [Lysobacterales bacterium 14-68-21]|jgi:ankyrin repeat protein|nr:MAG: hypothetical protein B7X45_13005 [Xanthomonadales bacterium 15-68-25]OZB65381.1 MAG: hypothetical protein B7X39_14115 [Xanthomonadales bacterium 14-68-21]